VESASGEELYRSPPSTWKEGREAPAWFTGLLLPSATTYAVDLAGGSRLTVLAEPSRAVLDAWDGLTRLFAMAVATLLIVNFLALWLIDRALAPIPVIADGLERVQRGELHHRLPAFAGTEAQTIGAAFNRMAQAVEDKVSAERKAREAETQLEVRREMARVVEQHIEEERRLIAHELHDEFGQSVTAIRSLALAITKQPDGRATTVKQTAQLISEEAARLYDAMHGLIPRLMPLSLDTLGLAETLENLVRDWQRRYPSVTLSARRNIDAELGPSVTLAIYRVAQEGLINALRHAQATRVEIDVESDARQIAVVVTDDGVGLPDDWDKPGHFGLRGLADRVARLGGVFHVGNGERGGVTVRAEIPLAAEA
jgi:two-component system sensor histidine kinase UhpB